MKTITIRLPDVEAAMLLEVLKVNKAYRDLQGLLINQIQQEWGCPDSVDSDQGLAVVSVRAAMYCCS